MAEDDDPLAGFDPDDALEKMRELAGSEDNACEAVSLFRKLDDWLIVGERLPQEWAHPEPGVIAERVMRNQPRRTSRDDRRRS
jgi:hypothetical protein